MYHRKTLVSIPVAFRGSSRGWYGWSPCVNQPIVHSSTAWMATNDHPKVEGDRIGWRGLNSFGFGIAGEDVRKVKKSSSDLDISHKIGAWYSGVKFSSGVATVNRTVDQSMNSVAAKELERTGLHMLMLSGEEWNRRCREWEMQYQPNIYCSSPEEILEALQSPDGALAAPTLKEYFVGLGFKRHEFMGVINEAKFLLGKPMDFRITVGMKDLLTLGLTKEQLVKALCGAPALVHLRSRKVTDGLEWFQSEMNMDYKEALNMLANAPKCFTISTEILSSNLNQFRSWGMNEEQLMEFVKEKPTLMGRDPDDLKNKFRFARKILGKRLEDILGYPTYLAMSERKITIRVGFYVYARMDYKTPPLSELYLLDDKEFFKKHTKKMVNTFRRWWKWEKQHLKDAVSSGYFLGEKF